MAVVIESIGIQGLESYPADVEAAICSGIAGNGIVGLVNAAVKESRDRIES